MEFHRINGISIGDLFDEIPHDLAVMGCVSTPKWKNRGYLVFRDSIAAGKGSTYFIFRDLRKFAKSLGYIDGDAPYQLIGMCNTLKRVDFFIYEDMKSKGF